MKKIYSFLMLLVMTAVCVTASAKTFTIKVDDQMHIGQAMITNNYTTLYFNDNEVEFEAEDSYYLMLEAATGYEFASIQDESGKSLVTTPTTTAQFALSELGENSTIVVTTAEREKTVLTFTGDPTLIVRDNMWTQYSAEDSVFSVPMYIEQWSYVQIFSENPNVAVKKVVADSGEEIMGVGGVATVYPIQYSSTHFTIETYNPDEERTASMTVKVNGNAEDVEFTRNSDYMAMQLVSDGEAVIKFNPETETIYDIRHTGYNKTIYQVKVNDEVVEAYYGYYSITVKDSDYVEITTDFPDVDVPVTFTFTNEGTEDVVSYIMVNSQNVENWNDDNFTVKLGSAVSVKLNSEDYDIASFVANGVSQYGSYYETIVTSETGLEFVIAASKKAPKNVTINCENYESVIVYKGYSYMGETYELTGPTTEIVVEPSVSFIQVEPVEDWVISFIEDNDGNTYSSSESIYVSDGMELTVGVKKLERDRNLTVYVGGGEWTYRSIMLSNSNYDLRKEYSYSAYSSENTLPEGYTTIAFADFDCPVVVSGAAGADYSRPVVYLNDQLCEFNTGTYSYDGLDVELQDGDVLKMFAAEPTTYAVTYSIEAEADVEVVHDHSHAVAVDAAVVHNVLEGTEVWIKADEELIVTVNDKEIAADENGVYAFAVNEDVAVKVASNIVDGISEVNKKAVSDGEIYNLQGIRVGRVSDASRLPAGVYIINGQKVRF